MAAKLVTCPSCRRQFEVPQESLGRTVVCAHCGDTVPAFASTESSPGIDINTLRDPKENTAALVLGICSSIPWLVLLIILLASPAAFAGILGVIILYGALFTLGSLVGRAILRARVRTHGIRVSPTQFPQLNAAAQDVCNRLHIPMPEIYVMQNSFWNAWAAKLVGTRMVVLLSGAVDSILLKGDMSQVVWLMGHEIGHHAAGHIGVKHGFLMLGAWCVWVYLWYSRRCEFTCDRIGLYAVQSAGAARKAICNMSVGAQLSSQVDLNEAIAQWELHRREFFVRYSVIYATHPPHLWRLQRVMESAQELHIAE